MTLDKVEKSEAIEEIFQTLAEFFKYPTHEFYKELAEGSLEQRLQELYLHAGYEYPANVTLREKISSLAEMKREYAQCFMDVTDSYIQPVESVYKIWTTDPTAHVPHARSKGYIMGDSALHIRYLLDLFQLEIPKEYASTPDHLTILLELYAFLVKNANEEQRKQVISDHFDWLGELHADFVRVGNTFYEDVMNLIQTAVEAEFQSSSDGKYTF